MGGCLILCALAASCDTADKRDRALSAYMEAAAAYEAGDFEAAVAKADKALAADGSLGAAALLAGKASYFNGDEEAAAKYLRKSLSLSPKGGESALWLARAYRASGKNDEARKNCELLLASDSGSVPALRLAATMALDKDDAATALAYLNRAVDASIETGLAFSDRAALRWANGDVPGTLADLDAALAILPKRSSAYKAALELRALAAGAAR